MPGVHSGTSVGSKRSSAVAAVCSDESQSSAVAPVAPPGLRQSLSAAVAAVCSDESLSSAVAPVAAVCSHESQSSAVAPVGLRQSLSAPVAAVCSDESQSSPVAAVSSDESLSSAVAAVCSDESQSSAVAPVGLRQTRLPIGQYHEAGSCEYSDDSLRDPDYVQDSDNGSSSDSDVSEIIPFPSSVTSSFTRQTSVCKTGANAANSSSSSQPFTKRTAENNASCIPFNEDLSLVSDMSVDVPAASDSTDLPDDVASNSVSSSASTRNKRPRPLKHNKSRPCLYCKKIQTNLNRHLLKTHTNEELVKQAAESNDRRLRSELFSEMRKKGIYDYNRKLVASGSDMSCFHRERSSSRHEGDLVFCSYCKGFYSAAYFHLHRKKCLVGRDSAQDQPLPTKARLLSPNSDVSDEFKTEILSKFVNDEFGQICQSDEYILQFGSRQYDKMRQKPDKKVEVRRSVMSDMRRAAHLYVEFRKQCAQLNPPVTVQSSADMFRRSSIKELELAIEEYTKSAEGGMKSALKSALNFVIRRFAKVLKVMYLIRDDDKSAQEVDRFLEVFTLYKDFIFGDASYHQNRNRQDKLRRPQNLPSEDDVSQLRRYTVDRIEAIMNDTYLIWSTKVYCELRDLVVSRLTLFNARRGGEPARLTIKEWEDAAAGTWLRSCHESESQMKITFEGGKGNNHLVSVLFPDDCCNALRKLSNPEIRRSVDINENNHYLFPATHSSDSHVSGWYAVSRVCRDAHLVEPDKITATNMRHRASTLYAGLDVPEKDRRLFYKHMGHAMEINENVYQAPLAEATISRVGRHLIAIDGALPSTAGGVDADIVSTVDIEPSVTVRDSQPASTQVPTETSTVSTVGAESSVTACDSQPALTRVPTVLTIDHMQSLSNGDSSDDTDFRQSPPRKRKKGNLTVLLNEVVLVKEIGRIAVKIFPVIHCIA